MERNLGYYIVDGKHFYSKSHAIYESSITGKKIEWYFNNEVWEHFSKNNLHTLGKTSLDNIYKLRAQQLRDKYDYLILHYSGGPDSHNVLMSFINNNIHLDEVYVKYSHSVDAKLYTPNTSVTGAENIYSEWDYCIKPTLEWLAVHHPNIKITVDDIFKTSTMSALNDDTFINTGHFLGAFEILRQRVCSSSLYQQLDRSSKVCEIYGIDKPVVFSDNGSFFMFFVDQAVNVVARHNETRLKLDNVTELFYWTPDMPEIVFEQSYRLLEYFRMHPELRHLHDINIFKRNDDIRIERMRRLMLSLIYTTWDMNKFQADKPVAFNEAGRSRDMYLLTRPEFQPYIAQWTGRFREYSKTVGVKTLELIMSKRYKVGEI